MTQAPVNLSEGYASKDRKYFSGARKLFIDDLPLAPAAKLLELGCGNGDTAEYALKTGKCGWCAGIELCPGPAKAAASKLSEVLIGDIETIELPYASGFFDILIMSEVLEHLRDPWSVLRRLHLLLKSGGIVIAGSPNVAYREVILMLLRGRWDLTSQGIMDRTHLRWFTPKAYAAMFVDCGFHVDYVGPAAPLRKKVRILNTLSFGRLEHLFHTQIILKARR